MAMESLDRNLQRRVWARVYESPKEMFTAVQRTQVQKCLQRCRANLAALESLRGHCVYQEAFDHLRSQTQQQIQMLQQMLSK